MERQHSDHYTLFLLLSILLLSLSLSTFATRPSPTTHPSALVISACKSTLYPSVCEQMLATYSPSSTSTPVGMALAGLDAALHHARSAQAFVGSLSSSGAKTPVRSREGVGAAKDCVETMTDGVDRIRKSIQEMGRLEGQEYAFHMSNVQTWVSAALTDENTCLEGFAGAGDADAPVKAEVRKRIVRVARVTSNALALVNRVATGRKH